MSLVKRETRHWFRTVVGPSGRGAPLADRYHSARFSLAPIRSRPGFCRELKIRPWLMWTQLISTAILLFRR
jgi:hypothetical protein